MPASRPLGFAWISASPTSQPPALPPGAPLQCLGRFGIDDEAITGLCQTRPDQLLVDLSGLPADCPGELIARLHARLPRAPILAFGPPGNDRIARQAIEAGAAAWLGSDQGPMQVLRALHAVSTGAMHYGRTGRRALRCLLDAQPSTARGWTSIDPSAQLSEPQR